jgi:hypothetical protein
MNGLAHSRAARRAFALALVAAAAVTVTRCSSSSPAAPLAPGSNPAAAIPDASLKATAPTAQAPVNDQVVAALAPNTFTAGASTSLYAPMALQYRFQLYNDLGTLVLDSGLMTVPRFTATTTLTPLARYTWRVRAEFQGAAGPWSSTASFRTPQQPPAYNRPIGDWERCAGLHTTALVECVWDKVQPTDSVGDMEVTKRVAWLLRGEGGGLLIKTSGENVVLWAGYSFSATRICFPDGHIYKIIGDAGPGGTNGPGFADNDFVDPSLYVPAIDPKTP